MNSQSISCLCYSKKYHLYFACSKDFKLLVFNEHLNMVYWQRMPVGLVQVIVFLPNRNKPGRTTQYPHDKCDQLLVGGKEGCFIIDLDIVLQYDAKMAILLDPKGKRITVKIKEEEEGCEDAGAEGNGEHGATRGGRMAEDQVGD